jgi:hypothetical protein
MRAHRMHRDQASGGQRSLRSVISVCSVVVVALFFGLRAVPAVAHHAFAAEYDGAKPVKLRGVVSKMEWINPHAWIHLDVKNPDGTVTKWMIEGAAPNALVRRGFSRSSLLPGTELIIEGFLAKDGSNYANGRDMTLADGKKLFIGSSGTGAPDERPEK